MKEYSGSLISDPASCDPASLIYVEKIALIIVEAHVMWNFLIVLV